MLRKPEADAARSIRDYLRECKFDVPGLKSIGVGEEMPVGKLRNVGHLDDLTSGPRPLNLLCRLFRFGWDVDGSVAREILGQEFLDACAGCGLLEEENGHLRSPVMLTPFNNLVVAGDHARVMEAGQITDAVLMVNSTTWMLHRFSIRRPGSTLELCAGSGAVGLSAAEWSDRVTLTDLSARAMKMAEAGAALNGIHNAEFLTGDGFAPVEGRRFDQILANPPFYVTPSSRLMYIENDRVLDQFVSELARAAPNFLNEGGWFQMLCEWVEIEGQSWEERIEEWFRDTGCDTWVMKGSITPVDKYAQDRINELFAPDALLDPQRYMDWMEFYRRHRIVGIHRGLVVMRRRSGRNWIRAEEVRLHSGPFGEGLVLGFSNLDFLASTPDEAGLLATRFRIAPGVEIEQNLQFRDGRFHPEALRMLTTVGLRRAQKIDPNTFVFLGRLDGTRTLGELTAEAARDAGVAPEKVAQESVSMVRLLLERGFLTPANFAEASPAAPIGARL